MQFFYDVKIYWISFLLKIIVNSLTATFNANKKLFNTLFTYWNSIVWLSTKRIIIMKFSEISGLQINSYLFSCAMCHWNINCLSVTDIKKLHILCINFLHKCQNFHQANNWLMILRIGLIWRIFFWSTYWTILKILKVFKVILRVALNLEFTNQMLLYFLMK